jgi:hypothetical protein
MFTRLAPKTTGIRTRTTVAFYVVTAFLIPVVSHGEVLEIGSRLEPLVDDYLIESLDGLEQRLHQPTPREVAITYDAPWEGNTSCYVTVFKDEDRYRMYFRGSGYDPKDGSYTTQYVCYAESTDGITWTKPELGLVEFEGSTANNIVWEGVGVHNFAPFKDTNPNCKPEARYKALGGGEKGGLVAFTSPDAINWTLVSSEPVITKGAFDSQNLAFYDNVRGRYVDFHRGFNQGVRHILTCTSTDFLNWTEPEWVDFGDTKPEHLYTNATVAYPRAPHIFMAFPKRFVPGRDTGVHPIAGVSDGVFMTSRDGNHWNRWREGFIRPGAQASRWVNRNNMTAWGMLFTPGSLPGTPDEISLYSTEGYYVGPCHLRRYTIRQDGFVSVHAGGVSGEFTTKPMVFADDPETTIAPATRKRLALTDEAINGTMALRFERAATVTLPNTQTLGTQATFAAIVRDVPKGHRRLFSAYNGGAVKTTHGEMWYDFDSSGTKTGLRFGCEGELIEADLDKLPDWSKGSGNDGPHLLVATWDDGVVNLYFDGTLVAQGGTAGRGALNFAHGDVLFGEDYAPAARGNEPFIGVVDDIIVLRHALTPEAVVKLADSGVGSLTGAEGDLLIDFEIGADGRVTNVFNTSEAIALPGYQGPADTILSLNYATSAAGSIRCEIQDASGAPIPGYSLAECDEIFGDYIARPVSWSGRAELNALVGKPVKLRFVMFDADLYSLRFQ